MKIGLLGMGVVGSGVMEQLAGRQDIQVKRVLTRRPRPELGALWTGSFDEILSDPEIDTIVEVMGGMDPAYDDVLRALQAGKNVVTANKWMLSYHLEELRTVAQLRGVQLKFSASVGGGIPYLYNLVRLRHVDTIDAVYGIVNGTTNLILDTMQTGGADFAEVLAQAQRAGYAEADPSADIDGLDARSKLCIASSLAFGKYVDPETINVEGIRRITRQDVSAFRKLGLVCRFIAHAERVSMGKICAFVEPTLVHFNEAEASVHRNDNLISLIGRRVGLQSFFGQGAGKNPTAANVVLDLDAILSGSSPLAGAPIAGHAEIDNSQREHRYYVRTTSRLSVPAEKLRGNSDTNLYLTYPMSIDRMHALAASIRMRDQSLFFAGVRALEE